VKPGERAKDHLSPVHNKAAVVSLVQRGGNVHSRHIDRVTAENLRPVIDEMVDAKAHIMTDSSTTLQGATMGMKHDQVNHSAGEYVRQEGETTITTNSVESYFAILKRGIHGVYHHVSKMHLHRYLNRMRWASETSRSIAPSPSKLHGRPTDTTSIAGSRSR